MRKLIVGMALLALLTGCASVKMEDKAASERAKQFAQPSSGSAGLYVYRDSTFGAALKKNIWVDDKCVGESAPNVFFYTEVAPGNRKVSTQSEFSPNDLALMVEAGKNYFVRQYIKMGVFIGGAGLETVPDEQGKAAVAKLELASAGTCSK
ncbi:DUF2846 domain-containing protein [Ramlibacter sp. PS3R-8]|uniref:DUF2846 domain-containing protein n=1 Tax=Ramlibacter sp. PS3R-8 TaxID=3133437 RepID=UPI0030B51957